MTENSSKFLSGLPKRTPKQWVFVGVVFVFLVSSVLWLGWRRQFPPTWVSTIVYDQQADTFSVEVTELPLLMLRAPKEIELVTIIDGERVEGIIPDERFRVGPPVAVQANQVVHNNMLWTYLRDEQLPAGMAYGPPEAWRCPHSIELIQGSWVLRYKRQYLLDRRVGQPLKVSQGLVENPIGQTMPAFSFQTQGMMGRCGTGLYREAGFADGVLRFFSGLF
ncbi:MAG: hypothetical protein ACX94C_09365 [Phycisphaerales bacterium]